jgi:phage tail-like protein
MSDPGNVRGGDSPAESQAAADDQASAAASHTESDNPGVQHTPSGPSTITADWGNAGIGPWSEGSTALAADWTNVGLRSGPMGSTMVPASVDQVGVSLNTATGISVFFTVTLDVVDLGYWTKVTGLGMTISTTDRGDTAMSFFQHHLPGHLTYDKITFERPVSPNSANIMNWISAYHMLPVPTSGQISCVDQTGAVLMTWDMLGVTPVTWKGPNFDANQHNAAMEQLTIHHMGFM